VLYSCLLLCKRFVLNNVVLSVQQALHLCRALKRKINGTSQDFWKEWVDVKGEYTDKGYVDTAQGVTGLPFLIAVVLGVFGALAYVVSQTSAPPAV